MIGIVATESIVKIKRTVVQNAVRPIERESGCVLLCVCSGVINFDLNNIIHFWEHRHGVGGIFWIKLPKITQNKLSKFFVMLRYLLIEVVCTQLFHNV